MLEYARWKLVVAALITIVAAVYSFPNLFPQDPAIQISANRGAVVDEALKERVQGVLEENELPFKSIDISEAGDRLLVRLLTSDEQLPAQQRLRDALGDNYTVALNLASTVPDWLTAIGAQAMALGLDLQGGVHFLMEVDQRAAKEKMLERLVDDARTLLRDNGINYRSVTRTPQGFSVTLADTAERDRAATLLGVDLAELALQDGVVTADGAVLVANAREEAIARAMSDAVRQNVATLANRVNAIGVGEPVIQQQGVSRIVVQLPGVQDTAAAKRILGATATLEYRAVDEENSVADALAGRVPPESRLYRTRDGRDVLLRKRLIATGDQLLDAAAGFDQRDGSPMVSVTLNNVAARHMQDFTNENVGRGMAVVFIERIPEVQIVDGQTIRTSRVREEVISIATVREPFGKRFQTSGLSSSQESSELALLLRSGALAAPMDIVEERIVGPSLGAANIRAGLTAVAGAFVLTLVFFLFYYRMFGVITCLALLLNLLLVVAIMSLMGATLTLPGLAGLALTVGLSVDANVLINERIREELRLGNSPLAAIQTGYDRATGTIVDANMTTFLAGIALFAFGTGSVKGFAVTLCLGIITSMYTAVSVARGLSYLIYGRRRKLAAIAI
jgi:preprotein translocase subunit SecD